MKWQPIETAPKDGTVVILADDSSVYPQGWWRMRKGWVFLDTNVEGPDYTNGWVKGYGPTHWMPLPDPPEAS